jgi:hypothetical protein
MQLNSMDHFALAICCYFLSCVHIFSCLYSNSPQAYILKNFK